jgi:predicted SAM-dependent methyltransferase
MCRNNYIEKVKQKLGIERRYKEKLLKLFEGKNGIEIGGPTPLFSSKLPIYSVVNNLDCCNFSSGTIWEGDLTQGSHFNFYKDKKGFQYIREAANLYGISSDSYDFLLASHCLEHCANTLKTLKEWMRVIKPGGHILLILPDKRFTFDHRRTFTSFAHLLEDAKNDVDEKDLSHLEEILKLHDLQLDKDAGNFDDFKKRSLNNYQNRCLHHHVFDFKLLVKIFNFYKIKPISRLFIKPYHQVILGKKK